jgi:hypothetical protein
VPRSFGAPISSLRTREEFVNFDVECEWKVQDSANSGCIYRLFTAADGMVYQIADDNGDAGARVDPCQRSGCAVWSDAGREVCSATGRTVECPPHPRDDRRIELCSFNLRK